MVVDFREIKYDERPLLVLRNLDGTPIQPLTMAKNISCSLSYNEVSELTFEIPQIVNGIHTPCYDLIVGMRIIEWVGIGCFVLVNPSIQNDGISEIKQCKAYSIEYELTYKKIFIEEGTYNFWSPVESGNTILSMILEVAHGWTIGTIDERLIGKYRTIGVQNQNIYDFIKNSLQDKYQCVFEFDTYKKEINVRSVEDIVEESSVFLSTENLIKEISIEENTEDIFTCLDVNGADGVDIRSVNPMGTNKIYNLDYFMNTDNFDQSFITKWSNWKSAFEESQRPYFDLTVEKVIAEAQLEALRAELLSLEGTLEQYETQQSVYVEAAAQGIDMDKELAEIKEKIQEQKESIDAQNGKIESVESEIEQLLSKQIEINKKCSFSEYFTDEELALLNKYIKEDAINESSFVYQEVSSYTDDDISVSPENVTVEITASEITSSTTDSQKEIYSASKGNISITAGEDVVKADIVRFALSRKEDNSSVFTAYLGEGTLNDEKFPSGCVSLLGNILSIDSDLEEDSETGLSEGSRISFQATEAFFYFTKNATEYEKRSVEWDLFEYGTQILADVAWPTYTFSVDVGNFFAIQDFEVFKNSFKLGSKIYLKLPHGKVLTPITVGAEISPSSPETLSLVFSDTYSGNDGAFKLVDLLDQSISMGKTLSSNQQNFNAFIASGASTKVKDFIDSALDVSKNKVLSSSGQSIQWDGSGFRLRKMTDGSLDPEQIWMINNSIVFTDDAWSSAKMAIGKFEDTNLGTVWGIVAPSVVGTLLAGNNLVIESKKQDGGISVFKVDADGARLYNSRFDLVTDFGESKVGQISLAPSIGLLGGYTSSLPLLSFAENGEISGVYTERGDVISDLSALSKSNLPRANFWVDMLGNAYLRGTIYAESGQFKGVVNAQEFQLNGVNISNIFSATGNGNFDEDGVEGCDFLQIGNITIDGTTGSITFNGDPGIVQVQYGLSSAGPWQSEWNSGWVNVEVWARYSYNGGTTWGVPVLIQGKNGEDGSDGSDANVPDYIRSTYIDFTRVESPTIMGNQIQTLGSFQVGTGSRTSFTPTGFIGRARGSDANDQTTWGVAIASDYASEEDLGEKYIIVTTAGIRLQAGTNKLTLTANGVYINGEKFSGSSVAVFG